MSEEAGEKSEQPTEKKLSDSRQEGQLPARKNIIESALIVTGTIGIINTFVLFKFKNEAIFDSIFNIMLTEDTSIRSSYDPVIREIWELATFMILISISSAIITFIIGLYLNKFNISIKSIHPKIDKLNPINGFKQMFSKDTFYNFFRTLLYFFTISITAFILIRRYRESTVNAFSCGIHCVFDLFIEIFIIYISIIILLHIILSIFDFRIQNVLFISKMKMTKDSVKREQKQQQGDPMIRGQRAQISQQDTVMPGTSAMTHVVYSNKRLVCIQYDDVVRLPPFIILKAEGDNVQRILKQLKASAKRGVHFLNMPDTANALFILGSTGNYIAKGSAPHIIKIMKQTGQR